MGKSWLRPLYPRTPACSPVRHLALSRELDELLSTSVDGVMVWDIKVRLESQDFIKFGVAGVGMRQVAGLVAMGS